MKVQLLDFLCYALALQSWHPEPRADGEDGEGEGAGDWQDGGGNGVGGGDDADEGGHGERW